MDEEVITLESVVDRALDLLEIRNPSWERVRATLVAQVELDALMKSSRRWRGRYVTMSDVRSAATEVATRVWSKQAAWKAQREVENEPFGPGWRPRAG